MVADLPLSLDGARPRDGRWRDPVADALHMELADIGQVLGGLSAAAVMPRDHLQNIEQRFTRLAGIVDLLGWEMLRKNLLTQAQQIARLGLADAGARRGLLEDILGRLLDTDAHLGGAGGSGVPAAGSSITSLPMRLRSEVMARTASELDGLQEVMAAAAHGATRCDVADIVTRLGNIAATLSVLDLPKAAMILDEYRNRAAANGRVDDTALLESVSVVRQYLMRYAQDPVAADQWLSAAVAPGLSADGAAATRRGLLPGDRSDERNGAFAQLTAELRTHVSDFAARWRNAPHDPLPAAQLTALLRRLSAAADHAGNDDICHLSQDVAMVVDAIASGDRELSPELYETIEYSLSSLSRKLESSPSRR